MTKHSVFSDIRRPKDKYENLLLALLEQHVGVEETWSYPICLVLDPSSNCNLSCPFCFQGIDKSVRDRVNMDMELFDKVIEEFGPYLFHVDLYNWGEPFLNRHLGEMVSILKGYEIDIHISTNFSLPVSDEMLVSFIDNELDCITVSIDGTSQQSYEKYRVRGNIDLALKNVARLSEMKRQRKSVKPRIDWQFLVFSFNEHEIPEARKMARELGVDIRFAAPFVDLTDHSDWLSTIDRYVLDAYKQKPDDMNCDTDLIDPVIEHMEKLEATNHHHCDWLYLIATINANGKLSPCCISPSKEHEMGDLKENSFRKIWNNQNFRDSRRLLSTNNPSLVNNPERLLCYNCPSPQLMKDWQAFAKRTLAKAPNDVLIKARRMLPANLVPSAGVAGLWRQQERAEKVLNFVPYSIKEPVRQQLRYHWKNGTYAEKLSYLVRKFTF